MKLDEYNLSTEQLIQELKDLTEYANDIDSNSDDFLTLATKAFKLINSIKD